MVFAELKSETYLTPYEIVVALYKSILGATQKLNTPFNSNLIFMSPLLFKNNIHSLKVWKYAMQH